MSTKLPIEHVGFPWIRLILSSISDDLGMKPFYKSVRELPAIPAELNDGYPIPVRYAATFDVADQEFTLVVDMMLNGPDRHYDLYPFRAYVGIFDSTAYQGFGAVSYPRIAYAVKKYVELVPCDCPMGEDGPRISNKDLFFEYFPQTLKALEEASKGKKNDVSYVQVGVGMPWHLFMLGRISKDVGHPEITNSFGECLELPLTGFTDLTARQAVAFKYRGKTLALLVHVDSDGRPVTVEVGEFMSNLNKGSGGIKAPKLEYFVATNGDLLLRGEDGNYYEGSGKPRFEELFGS